MTSVFGVMVVWPGGWNMTDAEQMQREGVLPWLMRKINVKPFI